MPSMPGWSWSVWPTVSPGPMTRLTTPFGTPASMYASSSLTRRQRRRGRRLEDDRVAGHQRRAGRAGGERHREVERADDREDAVRPEDRAGVDGRVAEVVHRVVVAVVVLHRLGVVAEEVGRLLDLAERLDPVLADLDRHAARSTSISRSLIRSAARRMIARRSRHGDGGPGRLGARGRRRRRRRRRPRCPWRTCPRTMSRSIGERDLERPVAVAPLAVDEVPVVAAEARPRLVEAGLEPGVELLVVGAQRRVGDLDARRWTRWSWSVDLVAGQGVGKVAVSLARRRRRPARRAMASGAASAASAPARPRPSSARLAGQDEDPAQPDPLRRQRRRPGGRRRPSRTPSAGAARPRSARQPGDAPARKTSGDGLPRIVRPTPGRELEPGDERRRRRASGPSGSATTGCGASPRARRRRGSSRNATIQVAVRQLVAARRR